MGNSCSTTQQELQNHRQDEQHQKYASVTISNEEQETGTLTCKICTESMTMANKIFKNSNLCVHPYCTECMIKHIQVKLTNNVSDIKCPDTSCKYSLEPLSCRPIITNLVFDKWCDVLCESAVLGVDRVYCPNRECMELILNECGDRNLKRCVCPYCKKLFCFGCKVPWHDGYSCKEGKKIFRDENDVAFDVVYKENKWKMCPKCGHCVERVDGCNRIICRCGTNFCYKCGKQMCKHDALRRFNFTCVLQLAFILLAVWLEETEGIFVGFEFIIT